MQERRLAARESGTRQVQRECGAKTLATRAGLHANAAQFDMARQAARFMEYVWHEDAGDDSFA